MKNFLKSKFITALILLVTVILAGIAIFTAIRLYQLRQETVAPTAPTSQPQAEAGSPTPIACTALNFTLGETPTPTPTPTATATPTLTPTPTATATTAPRNSCNGTCGSDNNCLEGYYFCYQGYCRDKSCPERSDCTCPGATTTPTPTATATYRATSKPTLTPTPTQAALPTAGTAFPTFVGLGIGSLLLIGALLLAL